MLTGPRLWWRAVMIVLLSRYYNASSGHEPSNDMARESNLVTDNLHAQL